jgi:hypothetical protein
MMRLGGNVLPLNPQTSSAVKGETLEDTIRVMENYCDLMVIRHPVVGSAQKAADYSSVPVLNAGKKPYLLVCLLILQIVLLVLLLTLLSPSFFFKVMGKESTLLKLFWTYTQCNKNLGR